MSRRKIGDILLNSGIISDNQLQDALDRQSQVKHRRLGELIVDMGHASDEAVARALAEQFSLEYVDPIDVDIDRALIFLLPRVQAEKVAVLPLGKNDAGQIMVAMADPLNLAALNDLQFQLKGSIKPYVASPTRLQLAIDRFYGLETQAQRVLQTALPKPDDMAKAKQEGTIALDGEEIEKRLRAGGERPYVDLVSIMLLHAIEKDASDIHIEPQFDGARVRLRIDGMLQEILRLPPWSTDSLVSRIKVVANMDVASRRKPQDGKTSVSIVGRRIDLRISVVPSQFGESVVIRVLDPAMLQADLSKLGWSMEHLGTYYRMVAHPRGMVLCVGPTGSGKTTTLYSTIHRLRTESTSIVTLEDPIEYTVDGIVQFEVADRPGMRFPDLIPALLRQDPNVIVIGEIRDEQTAKAAIQATTTGHLVLSTLHTTQTTSTIIRMLELGITPHLLGDCLSGVVAQRLLRRVCQKCSVVAPPEEEDWYRVGVPPRNLEGFTRRVGQGCPACLFTGYRGRVGVFEVLPISDSIRSLIQARASEQTLWSQARAEGLRTLFDDALSKVAEGTTTLEEVARVVPVDAWLHLDPLLNRYKKRTRMTAPAMSYEAIEVIDPSEGSALVDLSGNSMAGSIEAGSIEPPVVQTGTVEPPAQEVSPEPPPVSPPAQAAVTEQADQQEQADPQAESPDAAPAERSRLLVVDDAEEILQLVRITLEDDYEIELARDGVEALEKIEENQPDLVVLDVMMPRMGGYEVCQTIKDNAATADMPVIILSARGEKAHIKEGLKAGADDYLPKPFDPEELELRVRALLRRARR